MKVPWHHPLDPNLYLTFMASLLTECGLNPAVIETALKTAAEKLDDCLGDGKCSEVARTLIFTLPRKTYNATRNTIYLGYTLLRFVADDMLEAIFYSTPIAIWEALEWCYYHGANELKAYWAEKCSKNQNTSNKKKNKKPVRPNPRNYTKIDSEDKLEQNSSELTTPLEQFPKLLDVVGTLLKNVNSLLNTPSTNYQSIIVFAVLAQSIIKPIVLHAVKTGYIAHYKEYNLLLKQIRKITRDQLKPKLESKKPPKFSQLLNDLMERTAEMLKLVYTNEHILTGPGKKETKAGMLDPSTDPKKRLTRVVREIPETVAPVLKRWFRWLTETKHWQEMPAIVNYL